MKRWTGALLDLLTLGALLLMLLPIIWVFLASLKPDPQIMAGNLWPTDITFEHYRAILARRDFVIALGNSLIVASAVALITTLLALPAAYALSRIRPSGGSTRVAAAATAPPSERPQ
jgi:ABC-type glycerol-3-phosphate transport system permease component